MKKELFKNTIYIAIGKFSTQIISYLLLPLYTKILSTNEYGTYDFIVTACIFIVPFITLLMEDSMFRFLIDAKNQEEKNIIMSNTFIYSLSSLALWSTILFIILKLISYPYALVFVLYIISCIFITLTNSITRGMGKIKFYSLCNFILSISTILLNVLFITIFKMGVNGLLYSTIIANDITSLFIFFKLKIYNSIKLKYLHKKEIKTMLKYSFPLTANSISWSIINISDRLVITFMLGSSANGIYAIANKFPNILNTLANYFFVAFKENASKALKEIDYKEYYDSMQKITNNIFIAISLLLITIMPFIFNIFINEAYIDAKNYIPILIIALYYGNLAGYYGSLLIAFKDTKTIGKSTVIGAFLNLFVNILLIKYIGIYAAVLSTLVANYITNLYRSIKIKKYIKLKKIDNYYFSIILLIITTIIYYINNLYLNIISLLITIIYSLLINKNFIFSILNSFKKKKEIIQ